MLRNIGVISRSINYISDIKYRKFGLQKNQFIYITRIMENPGINLIDLANMLKVEKTTAIKSVNKLINLGYVEKRRDLTDKRAVNLTLTKKSYEIYDYIIEEENRQIEMCMKNFDEDERKTAEKIIRLMSENIEKEWLNEKVEKEY